MSRTSRGDTETRPVSIRLILEVEHSRCSATSSQVSRAASRSLRNSSASRRRRTVGLCSAAMCPLPVLPPHLTSGPAGGFPAVPGVRRPLCDQCPVRANRALLLVWPPACPPSSESVGCGQGQQQLLIIKNSYCESLYA